MKFLTAVLTSGNQKLLARALHSLESQDDVVIIVNTLEDDFFAELNRSEISTVYPIVRTESNGLPGKGHQSVLDYFLTTDYTHLIKIDGDDFFFPGGHTAIRHTLCAKPYVDALGLVGEVLRIPLSRGWDLVDFGSIDHQTMVAEAGKTMTSDLIYWLSRLTSVTGTENFWFDRIVCYSRKGAELARYSETLPCVVDVQMNCGLKLKHHNGELDYSLLADPSIYLYDKMLSFGASSVFMDDPVGMVDAFFDRFTVEEQGLLEDYFLPVLNPNVSVTKEQLVSIVGQADTDFELFGD
jgi:hypothetical protein